MKRCHDLKIKLGLLSILLYAFATRLPSKKAMVSFTDTIYPLTLSVHVESSVYASSHRLYFFDKSPNYAVLGLD